MYNLYKNGILEGVYSEDQLAKQFGISITTLRFNVTNDKELASGYVAQIAEDKVIKEKGMPTDPKMIALLKEWDKVREPFIKVVGTKK